MAVSEKISSLLKKLPKTPGIYIMKDSSDVTIYIGKAKNLKNRVKTYFQESKNFGIKTQRLIENTKDIEWIKVNTETEALILETNYIKEYKPKYNILMKDDKSFSYVRIGVKDDFPKISIEKKLKKDGAKYFGPKTTGSKLHLSIDFLRKMFPLHTCNLKMTENEGTVVCVGHDKYPCLEFQMKRCSAPCIGKISSKNYKEYISRVIQFFEGKYEEVITEIKEHMIKEAQKKNFEKAAKYRDLIKSIENLNDKQVVSNVNSGSQDIIGVYHDLGKTYVTLFQVRSGKMISNENFTLINEGTYYEMIHAFLTEYYVRTDDMPKEILLPQELEDTEPLKEWFEQILLTKLQIKHPQMGKKNTLIELAMTNAKHFAVTERARWESDKNKLIKAKTEILELIYQEKESKKDFPMRMECFDISHFSGDSTVASMSVFLDAKESKKDYRHYNVKTLEANKIDDFSSLKEILFRRLLEIESIIHIKNQVKVDKEYSVKKLNSSDFKKYIQKPYILILSGACGSGKTSLSKILQKKLKYHRIEGDKTRKKVAKGKYNIKGKSKEWYSVHNALIKEIQKSLEKHKMIVIDYFIGEESLKEIYEPFFIKNNLKFDIKILHPEDKEVLVERDKTRKTHNEGEEQIKKAWDLFEKSKIFFGVKNYIDNTQESELEIFEKYFQTTSFKDDYYALFKKQEILMWGKIRKHEKNIYEIIQFSQESNSKDLYKNYFYSLYKLFQSKDLWIITQDLKTFEEFGFKKIKTLSKDWKTQTSLVPEVIIKNTQKESGYAIKIRIPKKDAKQNPLPNFILIDGGKGQLSSVSEVFIQNDWEYKNSAFWKDDVQIVLCSIAKKYEEIFFPKESKARRLEKTTEGSYLLQRLRDEAHRFAITFNRSLRKKVMVKSRLDDIPGVGPATRKKLIKTFGSLDGIKNASEENIKLCVGEEGLKKLQKYLFEGQ